MLTKKDIELLRGMFKENNLDLRDEIHSCIAASERRMIARMDTMEERIITNIAEFMDTSVFPRITDMESEMTKVKTKLRIA